MALAEAKWWRGRRHSYPFPSNEISLMTCWGVKILIPIRQLRSTTSPLSLRDQPRPSGEIGHLPIMKLPTHSSLEQCQKKPAKTEGLNKIQSFMTYYPDVQDSIKNHSSHKDQERTETEWKKEMHANIKMTQILELSDKAFKAAHIKILQWVIRNILETYF